MKKLFVLSLTAFFLFAVMAAPVTSYACGEDKADNAAKASATDKAGCSANAQKASADGKAACSANAKKASADGKAACSANAQKASADGKAACSAADKAACLEKLGITAEECEKFCKSGEYTMVKMSIDGMTCGGCENAVTASLTDVPGVAKVGKVCHKSGSAVMWIDAKKAKNDALVTAVAGNGFKAEIIPAVVTVSGDATDAVQASGKGCSAAEKSACAKSCAAKAADKNADKTEGTK